MIHGVAELILDRGVVSNLARFCPDADLIVATQHRSQRRPLLLASLQVLFALEIAEFRPSRPSSGSSTSSVS